MKLTKKQTEAIVNYYDLGKVVGIVPMTGGWVNHSFDIKTDIGNFIVQVIGDGYSKWKEQRIKIQYDLLMFLAKKNFPYKTPMPLKNKDGNFTFRLDELYVWAYEKIDGKTVKRLNKNQFKQAIKALATYHSHVKDFKARGLRREFFDFEQQSQKYKSLKQKKPIDKVDRLIHDNLAFFEDMWNRLRGVNFDEQVVVTHSDFNSNNLIFKGGKLVGILDFDNFEMAPLAKDICIAIERCSYSSYLGIGYNENKRKIFLKEYEKHNKLTDKTRKLIVPCLLKDNCTLIWWFYDGMTKNMDKRYSSIVEAIRDTKKLAKNL